MTKYRCRFTRNTAISLPLMVVQFNNCNNVSGDIMNKVCRYSMLWATLALTTVANAGTINVNIAFKGTSQRVIWEKVISEFQQENPDIKVNSAFVEEETYKVQLPAWLTTMAPDIIRWHEGERMAYYASRGLLDDLSADWTANGWDKQFTSLKG